MHWEKDKCFGDVPQAPPAPQGLLIRFILTDQIWKVADKREEDTLA